MSTPFRLLLPRQLYNDIVRQAQAELPNECCGVLAGHPEEGPVRRVLRRYPLVNAAASPRTFDSDPKSTFAAVKDMRGEGLEILAVYHSHPTSAPVPSRSDLEQNYSPDVMNLIVSLEADVPLMRAWWLREDGYDPADVDIV